MFKTADVYCSEITFFHNDALPPQKKRTRKQGNFVQRSVCESCEKWNMKMFLKLQLLSAITRSSTNHEEKQ